MGNGGTSYEIHHSLFQNISRDRKIQSLLQKYILQKMLQKNSGGIRTEFTVPNSEIFPEIEKYNS